MLEKVKEWGQRVIAQHAPIDPSYFDDTIAMKTKWSPLKAGGASFGTHKLVEIDSTRLEMKKSLGSFLFGGVFFLVGLGALVGAAANPVWPAFAWAGTFGVVFTGVGAWVAWPTTLVFDATTRQIGLRKGAIAFSTVHAIQVIKEYVRGDKQSYWSYEINLVLKDGERLNIVDHGNLDGIRSDAKKISQLMGCKLWDATSVV